MQGYAQEICRTRFFVGLRIEVDAPGILAAIRPCTVGPSEILVQNFLSLGALFNWQRQLHDLT